MARVVPAQVSAVAVLVTLLAGCSPGDAAETAPTTPGAAPVLLRPADVTADALARRIMTAASAAGGVKVRAIFEKGSLEGSFVFGKLTGTGFVESSRGSGKFEKGHGAARYVYRDGPKKLDDELWVNDGTPYKNRPWAHMSAASASLATQSELGKTHPYYALADPLLAAVQPNRQLNTMLVGGGSGQITLMRANDPEIVDGVSATRYLWSYYGSTPKAGDRATNEVWLDASDRVVRLRSTLPTEEPVEFTATYTGWGRQRVTLPASAETATLPYTFR